MRFFQYRAKGETARRGQNGVYYPPSYLARHRKKGQVDLSAEAKDVVKAVKALIEVERKHAVTLTLKTYTMTPHQSRHLTSVIHREVNCTTVYCSLYESCSLIYSTFYFADHQDIRG